MSRRVVVTGLGALTPVGNNISDFWRNLLDGVSGAGPITRFDSTQFKTQFACEVKDFAPTDFLDRKEARKLSKDTIIVVNSCGDAHKDKSIFCLLYTSPSPRDDELSRMPSSA